ncbi:nitroreductase family protein [Rapidithrix thailandica]|uniref:Nitroreductase family protein n=1 Tax=Rapidithrix thailandica TaxID=413964 RepID=A0AAW9S691_9BACT
MNTDANFVPYVRDTYPPEEMEIRAKEFHEFMEQRRTVRQFSSKPIPKAVMEQIVMTASTAPSGAHKQPWTFCAVSNAELKSKIREAAEKEEYTNYHGRMSDTWLKDLEPFATDWHKPFLEEAPWLIIVFKRAYELDEDGQKHNNYYVNESVGLACGFLLAAVHQAGLVALTHTPSPMNFLTKVLSRPENERAFLLIPVGYPPEQVKVPKLTRKKVDQVIEFYE